MSDRSQEIGAIGSVIAGTYRVDEVLGEGGMGVVYGVTHLDLGEKMALKILLDPRDKIATERFLQEARAALRLKSEHATRVFNVHRYEDRGWFLLMEYLHGKTLRGVLEERGALPWSEAVEYVLQACDAIAEAHSLGIIHRDLKPSNLFLTTRADGSPLVKVLDFGISKMAPREENHELTATTDLVGSPSYMAPEQFASARSISPRIDVWALGTVLYELLANRRPFQGDSLMTLGVAIATEPHSPLELHAPATPAPLIAIIDACLEKSPAHRLPSVAALASALLPFCSSAYGTLIVQRIQRLPVSPSDAPPPLHAASINPLRTNDPPRFTPLPSTHTSAPPPPLLAEPAVASTSAATLTQRLASRWKPLVALAIAGASLLGVAVALGLREKRGLPGPATCADVLADTPSAPDGEYTLHVKGDRSKPWRAYCVMTPAPIEYLPLPRGPENNFSRYTAGGASPGVDVKTSFSRLRIDPHELLVHTGDTSFATSEGQLEHPTSGQVTSMPYASAMSCDGEPSGEARIDLTGTPFAVSRIALSKGGHKEFGSAVFSSRNQVVKIKGGGGCGWMAPREAHNPFNQRDASLRLIHLGNLGSGP